mgnify:CR=1 FL=1
MDEQQMTPSQFAEAIEINRSTLTHLFSGRNQPSLDIARKILNAFPEISTEWLIMGVGPMHNQNISDPDLFSSGEPMEMEISGNKHEEPDLFSMPEEINNIVKENQRNETLNKKVEKSAEVRPKTVRNRNTISVSMKSKEKANPVTVSQDKVLERVILIYNDHTFEYLNLSQDYGK